MPIALQDVIVTLIAATALLLVAWRLIRVAGPNDKPACSNCSSCAPAAPVAAPTRDAGQPTPLIWVGRQKSRT